MNIKESIHFFQESLLSVYSESETDALLPYMAEYVFSTTYFKITLIREKILTEQEYNRLNKLLVELKAGKPVQYIVGHTYFFDHKIRVNEHVLIPRPETEEVVATLLTIMKNKYVGVHVLDVGTGSGCIPVAIKHKFPEAKVEAMDISEKALQVARQNARLNQVDIHFFRDDILHPNHETLTNKYDYIISNPPYIPTSEKDKMSRQVIDHEPTEALFIPDTDPILFYKQLARIGKSMLKAGGIMVLEINEYHAETIIDVFHKHGYSDITLNEDMQHKPRVIIVKKHG